LDAALFDDVIVLCPQFIVFVAVVERGVSLSSKSLLSRYYIYFESLSQGIKRNWEELTGQPVPKRLRTDEFHSQIVSTAKPPAKMAEKPPAAKTAIQPSAATSNSSPAEPSLDVNGMSYNDIRKELKQRGISAVGKKTELADKLVNAMKKEKMREETIKKKEALGLMSDKRDDVVMEDVEEKKEVAKEATIDRGENGVAKAIVSKPSPAPKSALKPSKFAMKVASPSIAKIAPKPKDEPVKDPSKSPAKAEATKLSSGSESSNSNSSASKASAASKPTSFAVQTTPSFKSVAESKTGRDTSAVILAEKKQQLSASHEARKAKIAEMREKVSD
jgi:hypothetical protein